MRSVSSRPRYRCIMEAHSSGSTRIPAESAWATRIWFCASSFTNWVRLLSGRWPRSAAHSGPRPVTQRISDATVKAPPSYDASTLGERIASPLSPSAWRTRSGALLTTLSFRWMPRLSR